jgi:ABC-type phosphate/phosphonate transport system ATPase subunit
MITVNDISVQFGGTTLFSDVSFAINENDKIALMGKNGAGKSTLLKDYCRTKQTFYRQYFGTQRSGNCLFASTFVNHRWIATVDGGSIQSFWRNFQDESRNR